MSVKHWNSIQRALFGSEHFLGDWSPRGATLATTIFQLLTMGTQRGIGYTQFGVNGGRRLSQHRVPSFMVSVLDTTLEVSEGFGGVALAFMSRVLQHNIRLCWITPAGVEDIWRRGRSTATGNMIIGQPRSTDLRPNIGICDAASDMLRKARSCLATDLLQRVSFVSLFPNELQLCNFQCTRENSARDIWLETVDNLGNKGQSTFF